LYISATVQKQEEQTGTEYYRDIFLKKYGVLEINIALLGFGLGGPPPLFAGQASGGTTLNGKKEIRLIQTRDERYEIKHRKVPSRNSEETDPSQRQYPRLLAQIRRRACEEHRPQTEAQSGTHGLKEG